MGHRLKTSGIARRFRTRPRSSMAWLKLRRDCSQCLSHGLCLITRMMSRNGTDRSVDMVTSTSQEMRFLVAKPLRSLVISLSN